MSRKTSIAGLTALVLASLMASAAAQSTAPTGSAVPEPNWGRQDPARTKAVREQRQSELKAKLNIIPAQEIAWAHWTASRTPSADLLQRRAALQAQLQQLPTPERIERIKELRSERNASMDKMAQATLEFYAVLSSEQKKIFDDRPLQQGPRSRVHSNPQRM